MDDEPDWLSEDVVEEAPAPAEGEEVPAGGDAAPAEGEGAPAAEPEPEPEVEPPRPKDPNRLILYKHWMRPIHAQYSYLYDYRKNYYDDVIDYMDRRSKGLTRDVPRPQTWAERALRTYATKGPRGTAYERSKTDAHLLSSIHTGAKFYHYHTKEYMARRYPVLLR